MIWSLLGIDRDVYLILVGAVVAIVSGAIGTILQHILSIWRDKLNRKKEREGILRDSVLDAVKRYIELIAAGESDFGPVRRQFLFLGKLRLVFENEKLKPDTVEMIWDVLEEVRSELQ